MRSSSLSIGIISEHRSFSNSLKDSIRAAYMGTSISIHQYENIWDALSNQQVKQFDLLFVEHVIDDQNSIDSIRLMNQKWPLNKVVLLSQTKDLNEFTRAYSQGAYRFINLDQWTFGKINRLIQSVLNKGLKSPGFKLLEQVEDRLGLKKAKNLCIIEPDGTLLYELHFRLSKTLDYQLDAFRTLAEFYVSFRRFPDILLLSDSGLNGSQNTVIERLHTLKPDLSIILLSTSITNAQQAEKILSEGINSVISRRNNGLDYLEDVILNIKNSERSLTQ